MTGCPCCCIRTPKDIKDFADEIGAHPESISALHRKLKRLENSIFYRKRSLRTRVFKIMEYIDKGSTHRPGVWPAE